MALRLLRAIIDYHTTGYEYHIAILASFAVFIVDRIFLFLIV